MNEAEQELIEQLKRLNENMEALFQIVQSVPVSVEERFLEELLHLNANLKTLFVIVQNDALAEALEVAKDIRFLLAKATGHRVK